MFMFTQEGLRVPMVVSFQRMEVGAFKRIQTAKVILVVHMK